MIVDDIRLEFCKKFVSGHFTTDSHGNKTLELIGQSFIADQNFIFGKENKDYINKEVDWYMSQSTNINDIYNGTREAPKAWQGAADKNGNINSNYGNLIFSKKYHEQYISARDELLKNTETRRATMVYSRPSIWVEYNEGGKSDFICTNAVSYYIRDGKLHAVVQMRSNDAWAGYRNDYAWQEYVLKNLCRDINALGNKNIEVGDITWQVQNIHVYSSQFYLLHHFFETREPNISKSDYDVRYPNSPYI